MKVSTFNTGALLKEAGKDIKAAATATALNSGDLNNALLQAAPKTAAEVTALLADATKLVTDYKAKQAAKLGKEKTPAQKIIAALVAGTKANPSKLDQAAVAGGVNKTELNAALSHFLAKPENQTIEAAEAALAAPAKLITELKAAQVAAVARKAAAPAKKAAAPEIS
jgi:lambda repressor-like predicted transcriptional regulator